MKPKICGWGLLSDGPPTTELTPLQRHTGRNHVLQSIEKIISAEIESTDLIVIGAHKAQISDFLLGPNAARVVRHSKASVLVVRD